MQFLPIPAAFEILFRVTTKTFGIRKATMQHCLSDDRTPAGDRQMDRQTAAANIITAPYG